MKNRLLRSLLILSVIAAAAEHVSAGTTGDALNTFTDPTTRMEFVFVKGGCFQMGDTLGDGEENEKPVHEVCVSDYYIGKYEVTQEEWEKVMGSNPSHFKKGPRYPVEQLHWNDTQEFLQRLNSRSVKLYRLPTEAEWEYAARSRGKSDKFAGFSNESGLDNYSWHTENSEKQTHPVGEKLPNGLGLYDMTGNVWEWVQDWFGDYSSSSRENPQGPSSGSSRVLRGGTFLSGPKGLRMAFRINSVPVSGVILTGGFRVALSSQDASNATESFEKGVSFLVKNMGSKAVAAFEEALVLDPDNRSGLHGELYNNIGLFYLKKGDQEKAMNNFRKALDIDPCSVIYAFNLVLASNNDWLANKNEESLISAVGLFLIIEKNDESKKIDKELETKIKREKGRTIYGLIKSGERYIEEHNPSQAINIWNAVLELLPNNKQAIGNLMFEHYKNGDRERAIDYYEKAIKGEKDKKYISMLKKFYNEYLSDKAARKIEVPYVETPKIR